MLSIFQKLFQFKSHAEENISNRHQCVSTIKEESIFDATQIKEMIQLSECLAPSRPNLIFTAARVTPKYFHILEKKFCVCQQQF